MNVNCLHVTAVYMQMISIIQHECTQNMDAESRDSYLLCVIYCIVRSSTQHVVQKYRNTEMQKCYNENRHAHEEGRK